MSITNRLFRDFLRIFRVLPTHLRFRTLELLVLMVAASMLELAFIHALADMGLSLASYESVRGGAIYSALFTLLPSVGTWSADARHMLFVAGCVVVLTSVLKNVVTSFSMYRTAALSEDISIEIGQEIMQRYLYRSYAWHLSRESGNMFQRMLWRGNLAQMLINLLFMYSSLLTLTVLFLSFAAEEPLLTGFTVASTGMLGIVLYARLRRTIDTNARDAARAAEKENKAILCATKGIRDVIIHSRQSVFLRSVVEAAAAGKNPRIIGNLASTIPTWVLEAFGFGIVVAAIAHLALIQQESIARITSALALLTLTAWRVLPYCNRMVSYQVIIRGLRPLAEAVLDLLENLRKDAIETSAAPDPNFRFEHEIELRDIRFRYPESDQDSLDGISLTIRRGDRIGLIGPSGAGKSTLAGVICGLLPPTGGKILIDRNELTRKHFTSFSALIGYVPQSPFLFAGTLAENVAFSTWGEPYDAQRVLEACRRASIDFLDTHPDGIRQPVGENGTGLSGGQAQRVSIARALYPGPSVLVFDEATSALDAGNESSIIRTIRNLPGNVTSIIIAHRLSTVEHCDTLVWIDRGRIVATGRTQDILPRYRAVSAPDGDPVETSDVPADI